MSGLFAGTSLERPVTCAVCAEPLETCACPRDANGDVVLPRDQTARVRCERRRGNRTVTTIAGLDPVASDLEEICSRLRTACAAGGTVADGVIEIQGDHREAAARLLREAGYRLAG